MHSKKHSDHRAKLYENFHAPKSLMDDSVFDILSSIDSPRSLCVWLLYREAQHQDILDLGVNPNDYNDPFSFRDAYLATSLLSKSKFLNVDIDKEQVAIKKFLEFEDLCKATNLRFKNLDLDTSFQGVNASLLHAMTQKIDRILGPFDGEEFVEKSNWGPGVTTLLKGKAVSAYNKFHSENGITRDLYSLVSGWFHSAYPSWYTYLNREKPELWVKYEVGNSIVTVPKNSKTDRVIAIEPGLNLWFQKGVGSMIRRRLQRQGIDLTDQTRNQRLAMQASSGNLLATVDFSSASDSISRELIREVLPHEWFRVLDATRSKLGIHSSNSLIRWEKFSSMGNGFTFELESLVFYAAAVSVCQYLGLPVADVSVYGDDVILPVEAYELFSSFSLFLGFKVNPKKSFSSGYFRESCGSYYFDGVDVKPIFLQERIDNVQAVYKLANSIRNLAHRRNSFYGCDARFHRCWRNLFRRVPTSLRLKTSRELGDAGFAVNFDEACPPKASGNGPKHSGYYGGYEGYLPLALLNLGVTRESDNPAMLLARLKVPSTQEYRNTYTLRGQTRVRFAPILVMRWYNYGSWF